MNPGKMYYVYKYASLLYVFKNDYTMPIGISGSEKVAYIKADTSLIYYPGNVELDYIRNFIRYTKQSLDLQQRVFISETEKASIKEIIDKEIIVIDFWGTWCKPCVENMPKLNQEAALHPDVQFISLAMDKMKPWLRYVKKHEYANLDFALMDGSTEAIYSPGVRVFPTYMIIDCSGEILHGPVHTVDDVRKGLNKM
jgi:thiol-disulfide isomerase/thioredoxin